MNAVILDKPGYLPTTKSGEAPISQLHERTSPIIATNLNSG